MKRLILLAFFILLLFPFSANAHSSYYDFFDFENYIGNDETLSKLPDSGTYGGWGLNNYTNPSGNDGVTSVKTDKGTSLMLRRKYATYPGVYYAFKKQEYDVSETLHVSFSVKISGDITGGYGSFRFRKRGDWVPHNIIIFNNDGKLSVLGKYVKQNGIYVYYEKDKWYDVDVTYDVPTGYCKINISDDADFNISCDGCTGKEKELTSIQLVMFETIGSVNEEHKEAYVYLDNWQVNTVPKMYIQNKTEDFSDFKFSIDGTKVSKGWMLTDFLGKTDGSKSFAGVFEETLSETDKALALCKNNSMPLTLWGNFKNKVLGAAVFETDVTLYNLSCDVLISLGNSSVYEDALFVEGQSGSLYAFGNYTGQKLIPGKKYHIALACDTKTSQGYITTDDGMQIKESAFTFSSSDIDAISSYKISLKGTPYAASSVMKAVLDNISLSGTDSIYNSFYEHRDFTSLNAELSADSSLTDVVYFPLNIGENKFVQYIFNTSDAQSGVLDLCLSGDKDTRLVSFNLTDMLVTSDGTTGVSFDKNASVCVIAQFKNDDIYIDVYQDNNLVLSYTMDIDNVSLPLGTYMKYKCADTSLIDIESITLALKNDFDILSYSQTDDDTYTVIMNNPIDTNTLPTVKVNEESAGCAIINPYTIRIYHNQPAGNASIVISGIKDIFGVSKKLTCDIVNYDIQKAYTVSKPVFFTDRTGIFSPAALIAPGKVYAISNVKLADGLNN